MPVQIPTGLWKFTGMYGCAIAEPAGNLFCLRLLFSAGTLGYCECCQLGQEDTSPCPDFIYPSAAGLHGLFSP